MDSDVGDRVEPVDQLEVEIVEIAEAAAEEEVLADVAERPLDFSLGLGPVRTASTRLEAIMARQRQQRPIVDDVAALVLAGYRRLHSVVKDLDRRPAQRGKRLHVAAEQRLQVLVQDIPCEDEARVAEHQAEQPDDPAASGIVDELDDKARKVDLRLHARRGLEAHLVRPGAVLGPDRGEIALHRRIGTGVAELADLARQPRRAEFRESGHPLANEVHVRRELARAPDGTRSICRRLDPTLNILAHGLRVAPGAAGDGGDRHALSMQLEDHHQLSKSNHRRLLDHEDIGDDGGPVHSGGREPRRNERKECQSRNFQSPL